MKDPALLWYFNDWTGGTVTLSRHLKGCYIDLLSAQFNNGKLTLDEIKTVLGSDFGSSWPALQKKFKFEDSLYFNERLQQEKDKRINFTASRRKNAQHMPKHMENENRNINYLKSIPVTDLEEFYNRFDCDKRAIGSKAEDLYNYCQSKGKIYKDYKAFLINALKKDFPERKEKIQSRRIEIINGKPMLIEK